MPKINVIATARGYDGTQIREEGDVFEIEVKENAKAASWFEEYKPKEEKPAKAVKADGAK